MANVSLFGKASATWTQVGFMNEQIKAYFGWANFCTCLHLPLLRETAVVVVFHLENNKTVGND